MTEIPVNVATNIVQKLVDRAINETRYLCCFSNIAEDYENEKKKLASKQKSVEEDVKEAKNKNEEIVNDVSNWQSKAADINREDTIAKKSCFFGLLPNCTWLYRQGRVLERKTKEIKNLIESCKFDKISCPIQLPGVEYYSSEDFIRFKSRNSAQKQLHEALKNSGNYMIGLHGIGGSGKTKLVIQVGKEVQNSELFDKVIPVVVSNPPNVRKIQDDIASILALPLYGNESERSKRLWLRLRNGQKILIILDDVWEKLNFEEIGIPSRDNHEGCRVLLTTRDLNVCKLMGCQQMIHLELLPENEAWDLFIRFADISGNTSSILKDVAQKIAFECKGLPVAIIAMASTLKEHPLEDWKAALIALKSSKPIDYIHEDLKHGYICLRVSYDNLKSDQAKCLFLLCSMFPEDHEISNEELIRYAIGIGLCGKLESYQTSRSQVRFTKDKLINSCLLLNAKNEGCVKMHDLVRDVAHWIANNEIHEIMEHKETLKALQENSIVKQEKVRYLYCHNISDFSYQLDLPNLEILVLAWNNDYIVDVLIPDAFFDGMKGIRVLTLKTEYHWRRSPIQLRPTSIQVLKNLRSLDLRYCNLGDISVFGSLQKIETLELYHCSINELPNGIAELKKLRLFRLQSCQIKENPYKVIGRFSEIEELYIIENRISNGSVDRAVVSDLFDENRISPALERYHIEIGVDKYVLNGYLNESTSGALSIGHFDASISNAKMKDMMQRAEILCLYKLEGGCKSISPDFAKAIGGAMIELIKLALYDCLEIECLIDTTKLSSSLGTVFSNLITLRLHEMDNLKELCHGSTPSDFLQKLEDLSIHKCGQLQSGLFVGNLNVKKLRNLLVDSCPKLTHLFTGSITPSLVLLKNLAIRNCDAMEYIIEEESEGKMNADHDDGSTLGSDKRKISDSAVSSIDPAMMNCSQLHNRGLFAGIQKLRVESCPKLTYLFTVTVTQSLVLLEEIQIGFCGAMKCIIKDDSGETVDADQTSFLVSMFPKLQRMDIRGCGQLECFLSVGSNKRQTFDSTSSSADLVSQDSNLFNNVRYMRLVGCPQLKWVLTLSNAATMQLERLYIEKCDGLKHIITFSGDDHANTSILPKFRTLKVYFCKQLKQIATQVSKDSNLEELFTFDTTQDLVSQSLLFCNVNEVILANCPQLKWVFTLLNTATMQLENLEIVGCDGLKHIIRVAENDDANYRSILQKLRSLRVERCQQLEYVFGEYHQNRTSSLKIGIHAPALESLYLKSLSNMVNICSTIYCLNCPSLISYECYDCPQLTDFTIYSDTRQLEQKDIQELKVSESQLLSCNIQKIKLRGCPQLKSVLTLSNATIMQLEDMSIGECDGLKHIITIAGADDANYNSFLPKFRTLSVYDCTQLEQIATQVSKDLQLSAFNSTQGLVSQSLLFCNIKKVTLRHCPQLKWVFTLSNTTIMQMEELYIEGCDGLKHAVRVAENNDAHYSYILPKFRILSVYDCKQLEQMATQVSKDSNSEELHSFLNQSLLFHNVQTMSLQNCPRLKSMFTLTNSTTLQLEELEIINCDRLKHIISIAGHDDANYNRILPKLKLLNVIDCKQLEYVFGEYGQNHTSNVKIDIHAPALEGLNLKSLSNMISICSTRYYLKCPSLKIYWFEYCPQFAITSTADFMIHSDAGHLEKITIKGLEASNSEWLCTFGTSQCLLKQSFSNVNVIILQDCPQLTSVFSISNVTTMPLERLDIIKCDGLNHIITNGGGSNDHSNNSYTLQKLKSFHISHCKQLECVFGQSRHEDNLSYQNHTSNLEIHINLPALEQLKLEDLPNMISICTQKYYAICLSLKEFDYIDCPRFAKSSIIDFIENSNATQLKCNGDDSKELLKKYKQELQTEEEKFPKNVSHDMAKSKETEQESVQEDSRLEKQVSEASSCHTKINDLAREQPMSQPESMGQEEEDGYTKTTEEVSQTTNIPQDDTMKEIMKQSVQKIPTSEKDKLPASSLVYSRQKNSQNTKGSIQEDLASRNVEIETPPCPSSKRGDSMSDQFFPSMPKTSSQDSIHDQPRNQAVATGQQQAFGETTIIKEIPITDTPHDDNITGTVKQIVQEDIVPEKSKIETSLTNYGPRILSPGFSIIPIENALSEELVENEEVDFHGLFKIDSRRASLLDNAFVKYPHLWDWQKGVRTKYCKFGYESLSDMLLFLKEKTPKAMDESSKKEFEKLYVELLSFGFDRDWLASVHQRVTDLQVENEKLKHLIELESRESILLNNTRAEIAEIKDNVSKYETAFDF